MNFWFFCASGSISKNILFWLSIRLALIVRLSRNLTSFGLIYPGKKYRILIFCDKKYHIFTFRNKKYRISTFRDKPESYLTVVQQNNGEEETRGKGKWKWENRGRKNVQAGRFRQMGREWTKSHLATVERSASLFSSPKSSTASLALAPASP